MSTRVHELAKELGLKSPELIERIQKWGLDVKASALASLDPAMAGRIRQLVKDDSSTSASAPAAKPAPPAPVPAPPEKPAIRSTAPAPRSPAAPPPKAHPAPTAAPAAPAPPRVEPRPDATPAPAPGATAAPAPAPPKPAPPQAPADAAPAAPRVEHSPAAQAAPPPSPASAPTPPATPAPAPARPAAPAGQGPLATHTRSGGMAAPPTRGGGGPLSGHTPHRGGGSSSPPRPGGSGPIPQSELRPKPSSPAPLRPSDYISPAGTRYPAGAAGRPGAPQGGDGARRDAQSGPSSGMRRPLPQTSTPMSPPPVNRRPEGFRPGGGGGNGGPPATPTQRPEKRYTAEEMRAMMQAGQLGVTPPAPARPGMPPRPGMGPRPGGPPRPGMPSAPGAGPGLRRPPVAPLVPPTKAEEEEERRKGTGPGGPRAPGGGVADRAGRRDKRTARAAQRGTTSGPQPASALINADDSEGRGRSRGSRGKKGGKRQAVIQPRKAFAEIEPPITLRSLSEAIGVKGKDLMRSLMNSTGQLFTINTDLDDELALELALEFGVELKVVYERTAEDDMLESMEVEQEAGSLVLRPPIITILGHVDHGKTSLLDKIRKANVVATESGGITQHIGAYQVEHEGRKIAFVDTPGHEAFTAMRARGANVTDIVVLVVAADDGVMPQTQEAIAHAKAADVPVVIALNKTDLPNINYNKIYGELSQQGLVPEEYGGDTPVVKTSALTGAGIADLLETLGIIAELHELKANPDRQATGTCLEASLSEGRGVVATVLVQDGTLRVGDVLVCGAGFGRVRAMFDDRGRPVQEAGPSTPVEVSGLDAVPTAGEKFAVLDDIGQAREIAETRRDRSRDAGLNIRPALTLENLYTKMAEQKVKTLNLILKADVQGSLEALTKELEKLENPEVPIRILLKGVGGISESDIILADASQAIVVGFRVAPEDRAISLADDKKIDIRRYDIIYQVTDEIKKAVEGMLVPEIKEVHLGRAQVRAIYKISKVGTVAGCFVTQGTIERSSKARIIREGREIYKGAVDALKRFKDDVKEVREGFECGIKVSNFDDLKVDDTIEAYRIDVIRRTL